MSESSETPAQSQKPKKPRKRNRANEKARNKEVRRTKKLEKVQASPAKMSQRQKKINIELGLLAQRTASDAVDTDRDIEFAYRNSSNPLLMPSQAPSIGAWAWYEYARADQKGFLTNLKKTEEARLKASGGVTQARMEDDRRQKFAVIDKIMAQLTLDVGTLIDDVMTKFPEDFLNGARKKYKAQWEAYFKKFPL